MSSEISVDTKLNGDSTHTSGKNVDSTRSSGALPNQNRTSNLVAGDSSDTLQTQPSTSTATSTFKALSAGSYAERIRTSVPTTDNSTSTKIVGNPEEDSTGSSKLASSSSGEGRSNSGKRTGKNKSGSNSTQHRSAALRAGSIAETNIPNTGTISSDPGVSRQGKLENSTQQPDDSEQGWQEVTAKPRNQNNNKADKKEASSNGGGRHKQHGKKSLAGIAGDENAGSSHANEKPNKGKGAPSRKEKEKSDKESRQQQTYGDDGTALEPTRKQQQQQKEKESSGPKSLGMKSASWRSSPSAVTLTTDPAESLEGVSSSTTTTATTTRAAEKTSPHQSVSMEPTSSADNITQISNGTAQPKPKTTTQPKVESSLKGQDTTPAVDVKIGSIPTPAVPSVNIWQLRKEKMKSGSTKQPKQNSNSNGNGKSVFNSLTGTPLPANGDGNSSSKTTTTGNKADNASGKRQASGQTQQESQYPGGSSASRQPLKTGSTSSTNPPSTSSAQGKPIRSTMITSNSVAPVVTATSSATLTDVMAWPDVAASAVKNTNTLGGESKKKEREDDDNAQAVVVNSKKEKKKWTPIPPAELQEALDKAEKARKAASHAGGDGGKQKRRNSAVTTGDDNSQVPSKSALKKNAQSQNKAGIKSAQGTAASTIGDNTSKKGKGIAPVGGRSAIVNKVPQAGGSKERGSQVDAVTPAQLLSEPTDTATIGQLHAVAEATSSPDVGSCEPAHVIPDQNQFAAFESDVPAGSLLLAESALSPKRKGQAVEKQKGAGLQGNNSGRQSGLAATMGTQRNAYTQTRDGVRIGGPSGRGGRANGGKGSRNGNIPGSRYSDNGMALSPRGQGKAGILSSPPVGYQGLPYESSMAAAVHAPGFVPFGSQTPYAHYPSAYYYGSSGQPGPASVSSDAGAYNHTTTQQGVQQSYMPYSMPYMPQQRPVTEIPGLDSLRYYILGQIEYYFSIHNLCMDQFLKEQMDSHGWVDIPMIASFNRIRQVTADESLVKEVAQLSHILEIREDKMRLRDNWQVWVFPGARPSIFPEEENLGATRLEELAMHGVRVSDLSEETRERIVGDIQRDILRSKNTQTSAPPIPSEVGSSVNSADVATVKVSPPASVASDASSDKVDIILQL